MPWLSSDAHAGASPRSPQPLRCRLRGEETGGSAHAQTSDDTAEARSISAPAPGLPATLRSEPPRDRTVQPAPSSLAPAPDLHPTTSTAASRCPVANRRSAPASKPAIGLLYAGGTITSVKLPTQPNAEITMSGGVRRGLGNVELDFGRTYFAIPARLPPGVLPASNIGKTALRADAPDGAGSTRIAGGYAYSPNVSKTGAWSQYAAVGPRLELPAHVLPQNFAASFTAAPAIPGSAVSRPRSEDSRCRPISTGRRA